MINYEQLYLSLVKVFRPAVALGDEDYPLIQVHNKFKVPNRAFASIQILNAVPVGHQVGGEIFENGQSTRQDWDISIRIQAYGDKAMTRLGYVAMYLEYLSTTGKMLDEGLGWRSTGRVQNLPSIDTTEFEERAFLDFVLGTSSGDLSGEYTDTNDPNNPEDPNNPNFDPNIVPIELVRVNIYDDPSSEPDDEVLINTITIP